MHCGTHFNHQMHFAKKCEPWPNCTLHGEFVNDFSSHYLPEQCTSAGENGLHVIAFV